LLGEEEIEVVLAEREVVFRVGRTSVTTRLIEGDFRTTSSSFRADTRTS
jgi:DNA polymerase III sliding clamp (beta) subunit (PCNA family)